MSDGWNVLESLSTLAGSLVLVGGALLAGRYGRKANPTVEAEAFPRPDGSVILAARASVSVPGVLAVKLAKDGAHAPIVRVVEVLIGRDGELRAGAEYEGKTVIAGGERVGGGETVSKTDEFPLPVPTLNLVGWRVFFLVDAARWPRSRGWWQWAADCFVPVPEKPEVKPT